MPAPSPSSEDTINQLRLAVKDGAAPEQLR
jgi:hypothetical protein